MVVTDSLPESQNKTTGLQPDFTSLMDEARFEAYQAPRNSVTDVAAATNDGAATDSTTTAQTPSDQPMKAHDATLPPIDANPVKDIKWSSSHDVIEIAPGVKFQSWNFGGTVPGPVMAVNEGDEVRFTIENNSDMPHSIDFHSAKTPPDQNYKNLMPGESHSFTWKAENPGAFLYHCGTPMALHHMVSGMYGAVIVKGKDLAPVDKEFVLVQSEFSLTEPMDGVHYADVQKALDGKTDHVVFNGYSNQYMDEPLKVKAGEKVRMWVVNAGPSNESAFHVVGTVFDAAYPDGNPNNKLVGMQTIGIPPGGGAMVEFKIDKPGKYPFVTHKFGDASKGAVGILEVTP